MHEQVVEVPNVQVQETDVGKNWSPTSNNTAESLMRCVVKAPFQEVLGVDEAPARGLWYFRILKGTGGEIWQTSTTSTLLARLLVEGCWTLSQVSIGDL